MGWHNRAAAVTGPRRPLAPMRTVPCPWRLSGRSAARSPSRLHASVPAEYKDRRLPGQSRVRSTRVTTPSKPRGTAASDVLPSAENLGGRNLVEIDIELHRAVRYYADMVHDRIKPGISVGYTVHFLPIRLGGAIYNPSVDLL